MKKLFLALLAVFSIALVVAGCGGDSKPAANSGDKKVVLKVGATPVPHAEILNLIKWLKKALICRSLNSAIMLNPICLWLIKN